MEFSELVGKIFTEVIVDRVEHRVTFKTENEEFVLYHSQDCCESVVIDDVNGDVADLIGTPILKASEDSNSDGERKDHFDDSWTWTFYNLPTIKGHVQIKWYGSSNGYYSESVDFAKIS